MEATELQIVVDAYEKRIAILQVRVQQAESCCVRLSREQLCQSKDGHKFEEKNQHGVKSKACKWCGKDGYQ